MKLFFIEEPEGYLNTSFELVYQIKKITFNDSPILYFIFRDDNYFANVMNLRRIIQEQPEAVILTNDDRMLGNFRIDEVDGLYFWNYKLEKFISHRIFYPNIRKINNIESMWRREVFPDAYYHLKVTNNEE